MTRLTIAAVICSLAAVSCGKDQGDESGVQYTKEGRRIFADEQVQLLSGIEGLAAQAATIRPDLAAIFCISSYKLPLQSDFSAELGILCEDNKPTAMMNQLDQFAESAGDHPKSVELSISHEGEFTHATYATAYKLPIPPKWIKSGKIHDYMMTPAQFDGLTLDGQVTEDLYATIGGDLQFSKLKFSYESTAATPDGGSFSNKRNTEFNAYQVQGGNPDIGLGAEHLTDTDNPDFLYFNAITVTIADTSGGSVIFTIIRGAVKNNGYPDIAQKIFSDTTLVQGVTVHDGLKSELNEFVID